MTKKAIDVERLSYYDFFAANPYVVVSEEDPIRLDFELEGFEPNKLEYASSAQRYTTKRESIKQYLALLLSKDLINVENEEGKIIYKITERGSNAARQINTMYALAYRKSVERIIKMMKDLSDARLWENARKWLEAKSFQIDLYYEVDEKNE